MTYFSLIRVNQWIKNLLIFATPLAIGNLNLIFSLETVFFFLSFSMFVSSTYIINDIVDVESDRLHPQKRNRPIASGKISTDLAKIIFLLQFLGSLIGIFTINSKIIILALSYLVITSLYTYKLKYKKYLDIIAIATLFALRIYVGSYFFNIPVSLDLFIVIFFLSVLIVASKKYSIRNNPKIQNVKIKSFLLSSYTNRNLLAIFHLSSILSSLGLLYWILDNKFLQIINLDLIIYFLIFLLYVLLLYTLYSLTIKQKTEELVVTLFDSKSLLVLIFLIIFIYIYQII